MLYSLSVRFRRLQQIRTISNIHYISLILIIVIQLIYILFVLLTTVRKGSVHQPSQRLYPSPPRSTLSKFADTTDVVTQLAEQRNQLSGTLNRALQLLGMCQCETEALSGGRGVGEVTGSGGWCGTYSNEDGGEHITDTSLARGLSKFFQGDTVASFGDGPGRYAKIISELKEVKRYDAYDGSPYTQEMTGGVVRHLDLSIPQFGLPLYDWIVSLEVAEHIPSQFELVYLDNIWRHARLGVVITWAVPGQFGFHHVNGRTPQWLVQEMEENGFDLDKDGTAVLKKSATKHWLADHIHVFRRRNVEGDLEVNA